MTDDPNAEALPRMLHVCCSLSLRSRTSKPPLQNAGRIPGASPLHSSCFVLARTPPLFYISCAGVPPIPPPLADAQIFRRGRRQLQSPGEDQVTATQERDHTNQPPNDRQAHHSVVGVSFSPRGRGNRRKGHTSGEASFRGCASVALPFMYSSSCRSPSAEDVGLGASSCEGMSYVWGWFRCIGLSDARV